MTFKGYVERCLLSIYCFIALLLCLARY